MSFDKLQKQVAALLAPVRATQTKAEETKRMTAAEFATYAEEQIQKARKESESGKVDLSKRRLTALQSEVTRLAKFEFKPSELPAVTVYKDPEQLETTEEERSISSGGNSEPAANHWTAKAQELAKHLAEALGELSNRPTDKNQGGGEKPGEEQPPTKDPKEGEQAPAGDPPQKPEKKEASSFVEADREHEWPRDLAKSLQPSARDKDADYDWGKDAPAAAARR